MATFDFTLKGRSYSSPYTDSEAARLVSKIGTRNVFAESLVTRFNSGRPLSPSQREWLHKLALDVNAGSAYTANVLKASFVTIANFVTEYGHKVFCINGQDVVFSLASRKSSMPGAINCTDGKSFGEARYYGRIYQSSAGETLFSGGRDLTTEIENFIKMFGEDPEEVCLSYGVF